MAEANENNGEVNESQEGQVHESPAQSEEHSREEGSNELSVEALRKELKRAREDAAKYRVERNELSKDAEAYRKIKESEKTDLERQRDEMEKLKAELNEARQRELVKSTMIEFNISSEDAVLLGTGTEEELRERAERIAALRESAAPVAPPSDRPREGLRYGGGAKNEEPDDAYPSDWL